jgi:ABC-type branched-subunit amino acid transport system ATPase component
MIALESVSARLAPVAVHEVSLSWGPGVHAVIGAPHDGPALVLRLLSGRPKPRTGRVLFEGRPPTDRAARRAIALVPLAPALPDALTVREVLRVAAAVRGEDPHSPEERLRVLGVEALAPRAVRSLAVPEVRAVALVEAITSRAVRLVLVEEPYVALDPRAASKLREGLRARASEGLTVVVTTASSRDAAELADDQLALRRGRPSKADASFAAAPGVAPVAPGRWVTPDGPVRGSMPDGPIRGLTPDGGARMILLASDPRALVASLAREAEVEALARRDGAVVVRGRDAFGLAQAAARAVLAAGVDVLEMRLDSSP